MAGETQASRNAEGFIFLNAEDAGMAAKERKQVDYLEAHLDYRQPQQVMALYERLLRERVFRTPVGMIYLKHLQDFLLGQAQIDSARVPMIPVYTPCTYIPRRRERPTGDEADSSAGKTGAAGMRFSVILNILLLAAVVVMFVVAFSSGHPNILNYRSAILNEYASWQQDLSEREQVIREKERELKIME